MNSQILIQEINNLLRLGRNPNEILNNLLKTNPQIQNQLALVQSQMQQNGMSLEQVVRQIASQQGLDINTILNNFRR